MRRHFDPSLPDLHGECWPVYETQNDVLQGVPSVTVLDEIEKHVRKHVLEQIAEEAEREAPREAVGFVVQREQYQGLYVAENRASDPTQRFLMHPADLLKAKDEGELVCLYHSHPGPNMDASPSPQDKIAAEKQALPYLIYCPHRNEWSWYAPTGYRAPLVGRVWVEGVQDCFTLVQDYFRRSQHCSECGAVWCPEVTGQPCEHGPEVQSLAHGLQIPTVYREDRWWNQIDATGAPLYDYWRSLHRDAGLVSVPPSTFREHDILVMRFPGCVVPHHGAVYLGGGKILHHLSRRLSNIASYGPYYKRHTELCLRHHQLVRRKDIVR